MRTLFRFARSQRRTVLSSLPDSARRVSGLNTPDFTQLLWPLRLHWNLRVGRDHTLRVLSSDAVSRNFESAENVTLRTAPLCPRITVLFPLLADKRTSRQEHMRVSLLLCRQPPQGGHSHGVYSPIRTQWASTTAQCGPWMRMR